jgi:LysM repeat protein
MIDIDGAEGGVPKQYTIKEGDNFWNLSKQSGGAYSAEDLQKWNPDANPNKLQIGQSINVSNPNKPLLIGTIGEAGTGRDFEYGYDTQPETINVRKQSKWTNKKLFEELDDALTDGTFGDQDDEVKALMAHFKKNTGADYTWWTSTSKLI